MENRIFRDQITNHFNRDELITLCFDLGIDHEAFPENISKHRMVQEIISYCQRHGKTDELLAYCQMSRPKIDWSLEHFATRKKGKSEPKSATHILENIVPAGPIQPDGGLTPNSINAVKDLINYWNNNGKLSLLVRVITGELEKSESLFHWEDQTYLFTEHSMHQVWVGTSDINHKFNTRHERPKEQ